MPDAGVIEALRAHCAASLAPYKVPKRFFCATSRCRARARASCCGASCDELPAMSFDANAHREASLQGWEEAAAGWVRSQELLREFGAPVSHWMLDAVAPQPGQRVLELAAGLGETGLLAAELVAPVGGAIISDQAEAMLAGARERAAQIGLANVEFQVINAEWIDMPVASVDVVLCRWGYMLMADPAAALGETRRVLRSGGRVALAVWDSIEHNPWAQLPGLELRERGLAPAPEPGTPGPFALGRAEGVYELLQEAGFAEVNVESLQLHRRHAELRRVLGVHTRPLARDARRRALAPAAEEIEEIQAGREGALQALRSRRRDARHPRTHACRSAAERLTSRRGRTAWSPRPDSLRAHDLRRRRRPHAPRRQDRRNHRLRLPGPRPRAQPEGLRRESRRRAAARLGLRRQGQGAGPRGALRRRCRQPRRPRDDPAARRAPPRHLGAGDPRRHRRGQHDPLRPRLLDPLQGDRAAARRRRGHGRAEGPRPPRSPPVHRRLAACPG